MRRRLGQITTSILSDVHEAGNAVEHEPPSTFSRNLSMLLPASFQYAYLGSPERVSRKNFKYFDSIKLQPPSNSMDVLPGPRRPLFAHVEVPYLREHAPFPTENMLNKKRFDESWHWRIYKLDDPSTFERLADWFRGERSTSPSASPTEAPLLGLRTQISSWIYD